MSCYFCDSPFHLSHNCEEYDTIESREKFIASKNRCIDCLLPEHPKMVKCLLRCSICFSNKHHVVFCSSESDMFIPKIDQVLFPRFLQCLSLDEQYAMALTYPGAMKPQNLKTLVVRPDIDDLANLTRYSNSNFAVNLEELYMSGRFENYPLITLMNQKSVITKARRISLYAIPNCPENILLQLLTPFTEELTLSNLTLDKSITLSKILQKLPNIEKILLHETKLQKDKSWLETFLRCKNGDNFRQLTMALTTPEFFSLNLDTLTEFLKTKMCDNGEIFLRVCFTRARDMNFWKQTKKHLQTHFAVRNMKSYRNPKLKIIYGNNYEDSYETNIFFCK